MPKKTLEHLITTLHERFGSDLVSPEQQKLLQDLQAHMHNIGDDGIDEKATVDADVKDTLTLLIEAVEEEHPQAAVTIRQVVEALGKMGI